MSEAKNTDDSRLQQLRAREKYEYLTLDADFLSLIQRHKRNTLVDSRKKKRHIRESEVT